MKCNGRANTEEVVKLQSQKKPLPKSRLLNVNCNPFGWYNKDLSNNDQLSSIKTIMSEVRSICKLKLILKLFERLVALASLTMNR